MFSAKKRKDPAPAENHCSRSPIGHGVGNGVGWGGWLACRLRRGSFTCHSDQAGSGPTSVVYRDVPLWCISVYLERRVKKVNHVQGTKGKECLGSPIPPRQKGAPPGDAVLPRKALVGKGRASAQQAPLFTVLIYSTPRGCAWYSSILPKDHQSCVYCVLRSKQPRAQNFCSGSGKGRREWLLQS